MSDTDYNIKLYVSTFNSDTSWVRGGTRLEVGAAGRETPEGALRDDTGDNISEDNAYWGELTGLYWIWKNVDFEPTDIVGFCHYNKCLDISERKLRETFRNHEKVWVVRDLTPIEKHTYPEDIEEYLKLLKEDYPEYYRSWNKLYTREGESRDWAANCCNCEMFYTTPDELNRYCEFLFGSLSKLRAVVGDVDRERYHKRYCAFIGERLLSVYLMTNKRSFRQAYINANKSAVYSIVTRPVRGLLRAVGYEKSGTQRRIEEKLKLQNKSSYR